MKSLVVYCSHKGNTHTVAEAIGEVLRRGGDAEVLPIEAAPTQIGPDVDLLVVGGPTEGHGMTPEVRAYLDRLDSGTVRDRPAAAFDTRVDWPRILSGSAADGIEKRLAALGARVVHREGSFIVDMEPQLKQGELERARDWAAAVMEAASRQLVGAS